MELAWTGLGWVPTLYLQLFSWCASYLVSQLVIHTWTSLYGSSISPSRQQSAAIYQFLLLCHIVGTVLVLCDSPTQGDPTCPLFPRVNQWNDHWPWVLLDTNVDTSRQSRPTSIQGHSCSLSLWLILDDYLLSFCVSNSKISIRSIASWWFTIFKFITKPFNH